MQKVWHRASNNSWYATFTEAGRQKQRKLLKSSRSRVRPMLLVTVREGRPSSPIIVNNADIPTKAIRPKRLAKGCQIVARNQQFPAQSGD
jgi:hypothetical protein